MHWEEWCSRWSSNTLATWCKKLTHWKRSWCWERLKARREGDNSGWDGWMASLTQLILSLSKLWELVMDREAWRVAFHEVAKCQTWLRHWTEPIHFTIIYSSSIKCHRWFDRDYFKSVDCFTHYGCFNNTNYSNPRSCDITPFLWIIFNFL